MGPYRTTVTVCAVGGWTALDLLGILGILGTSPNFTDKRFRLDIMHHLALLMMDDRLHLAPLGRYPQKILDIGTGTGIWAIDMAEYDKHSDTQICIMVLLQYLTGVIHLQMSLGSI
jgi:hypothetical protein